jgi:gliding motility-associated-like protein
LDYGILDTLVCGSKTQTLNIEFVGEETAKTILVALNPLLATVTDETTLSPTITVHDYGKYQFKMQVNDEFGCVFIDTLNIEFHYQPEAIIVMDEEECKGYSLDLSFGGNTEEDAMFYWYYNDSVYQSGINLESVIIPLGFDQIDRTVGLKVNEQGCVDSTTQDVQVTPNITFSADLLEGCTPLNVNFTSVATEQIDSYFWDFGNGENSDLSNPVVVFQNPSTDELTFDVALTVSSTEGCENTGVKKELILVHPIHTVDFSFNEDDCNEEQMEIYYVGSGSDDDIYNWDLSEFLSEEIITNPGTTKGPLEIKRSSEPTVNIGIQVVSEFSCQSDTLTKLWKRKPLFKVIVDTTEGCPPLNVSIQAEVLDAVDEVSFSYELGDGNSANGDLVEHIYPDPNTEIQIRAVGTSSVTGCSETVTLDKTVFVYPVPEAAFTPDPESVLISDPEIRFENLTTGANYYEWDFGDMSPVLTEYSPVHQFSGMGLFKVSLFAENDYNCFDSISHNVAVTFDKLYPPNAFSPNATLEEDREFRIYSGGLNSEGYQLLIFNRWGETIFESNSQEVGWNGKMKNSNFAPSGVYTWVVQYNDFMGQTHHQQGIVTLVF